MSEMFDYKYDVTDQLYGTENAHAYTRSSKHVCTIKITQFDKTTNEPVNVN